MATVNFGYEIKGGAEWGRKRLIEGSKFQCPTAGQALSITAYLKQFSSYTPQIKYGIYKYSDASLIGYTETWTMTSGWDGEKTLNIASGGALEAETDYVLVYMIEDNYICTYNNDIGGSVRWYKEFTWDDFPNPIVDYAEYTRNISIYCTYEEGAPPPEPPIEVADGDLIGIGIIRRSQ